LRAFSRAIDAFDDDEGAGVLPRGFQAWGGFCNWVGGRLLYR